MKGLSRRCKLFFAGYTRPPFALIEVAPRGLSYDFTDQSESELYLWPDRIRWDFFFIGLFVFFWTCKAWGVGLAFVAALISICVFPWLIYRLFRSPVLDRLWNHPAVKLTPWFRDTPKFPSHRRMIERCNAEQGDETSFSKRIACSMNVLKDHLSRYLPLREEWDAVYWTPGASTQEAMLRAAICEFYDPDVIYGQDISIWHNRGFRRWLFYWLAPVWVSFLNLVILLFITVSTEDCHARISETMLAIALFFWVIYGIVYVWRSSRKLVVWSDPVTRNYLERYIPAPLSADLLRSKPWLKKLTEPNIQILIGVVQAVGFGFYMALLGALYPN